VEGVYSFTVGTEDVTVAANFTTATGVENIHGEKAQSTKVLRNGVIYILRGDKTYTIDGQQVR